LCPVDSRSVVSLATSSQNLINNTRRPSSFIQPQRASICVLFPAPSIPEKLTKFVRPPLRLRCDCIGMLQKTIQCWAIRQFGRLGLPLESATTVPMATAAPTTTATRIAKERARRCFAGAITAPAGLDAAMPVFFS